MLDNFRNLSDQGKMTVIAIAIAVFITAIVILGTFLGEKEKVVPVDDTPMPYSSQNTTPVPTETPTATPSPSASATPITSARPDAGVVHGETSLSVEDQQNAQKVANDGIVNYFQSSKGETLEAANARLANYFAPESGVFGEGSINNYFNMQKTDNENYIISEGVIDYIDPVGGDTKKYKVVAGITYRVQFNRSNEMPQVLEKNGSFTMLLSKDSGAWKITYLDES